MKMALMIKYALMAKHLNYEYAAPMIFHPPTSAFASAASAVLK